MRIFGILVLLSLLGLGFGLSYFMYRQLGTGVVTLDAAPQFVQNEDGNLCADVDLSVKARSLGRWPLLLEDGQNFYGVATVQGSANADIGLRIISPANRLVVFTPQRQHEYEFAVTSAIRGEYTFELDNRHSTFAGKDVTISVCLT